MADQPIVMLRPAPGTVIDGLNLDATVTPSGSGSGIYINCYPAPSDPSYVCQGLTIRNCKVNGFQQNITIIGPQRGTLIYGNSLTNATQANGNDAHGLYCEGLQGGCQIHDNLIANNGWWASYDPTDPTQRTQANRHHGCYFNESAGMDDSTLFWNNVVIDSAGSNVGCRHALTAWNNVFRNGGDWDLIVGQWAKGPSYLFANACFGPRTDTVPYYGGGIHLLSPGVVQGNLYSNSASITYNPAAVTEPGGVVQQQIGFWPRPGATVVPVGMKTPKLEDWCKATYGTSDVSSIKPGDAPKIVAWLSGQLVSQPAVVNPAPLPAPFDVTVTVDPVKQTVTQKGK